MIEIGQTIGNYAITAKLGEGGMGMVFLAEHPVIGRRAALKVIHPEYARNPEVVSRFVTEARSLNAIGHEHIVEVTDFGTTPDGDFYFIMERLEGHSLAHLIVRDAPFTPERALRIAGQIAAALQASHDHGIIHRDLKPDNIYLVTHGEDPDFVKVLDFGLAKLVGTNEASPRNTRTGTVVGTPYYMAPEQCEGSVEIDHRADVYALGVLLFEMLTGKVPFGGTGFGEVMLKHMTMPAPAARGLVPELAPAVDAILFRALAKDPAQRFQSMAELGAALADPEGYAAATPHVGVHDDLSGRMRAARPMKRSEMRPATPHTPTTLREGIGEIGEDVIPRTHFGRGVALATLAAAAAFVALAWPSAYKPPMARVVAAAHALSRPATVRLNFSSDPDGATVRRSDGKIVGVTPLSIEAPYGDAATEYVFQKPGFFSKKVAIVPNLPSPLFAVLVPVERAEPVPIAKVEPASTPTHSARSSSRRRARRRVADIGDGDETLAPTEP
jgi:serine/threonine-protein kinase